MSKISWVTDLRKGLRRKGSLDALLTKGEARNRESPLYWRTAERERIKALRNFIRRKERNDE